MRLPNNIAKMILFQAFLCSLFVLFMHYVFLLRGRVVAKYAISLIEVGTQKCAYVSERLLCYSQCWKMAKTKFYQRLKGDILKEFSDTVSCCFYLFIERPFFDKVNFCYSFYILLLIL